MKNIFFILLFFTGLISCKPLSVLFVIDKFPYQPRQYIDNQIAGFIDAGIDVTILANTGSNHENYHLIDTYQLKDKIYYRELPEDKRNFDIIYCQFSHLGKRMAELRANNAIKGKLIVCIRGISEIDNIKLKLNKYKFLLDQTDLILVVCEAFKEKLIDIIPNNKILVHHSAIDIEKFNFKTRRVNNKVLKLITISRLRPMKGHEYIILAIAKLKMQYPNIQYHIFGEGQTYEYLQDLIIKHNLQNNVFLRGYCDHDNLKNLLHQYHIFLMGSCTKARGGEGIPNALMEAMATGMPVIATKHSGIPELVEEGISGYLVPERDYMAFVEKIIFLYEHQELWASLGKAGRKKVIEHHNKKKQNQQILKIFKALIENNDENIMYH